MKKDSKTQLTTLETALQKQFKPDESRLETIMRESYELTAKIQSANISAIMGFGLLALSIKPIIGHGKFGGWLKETLGGQLSKSTAYSWIEAAKYLIAKVSSAEKQTDIISERICEFISLAGIRNGAEEIFSDSKLTSDFVAHVSANLPFKTFLNILKTANAAAIEAEDEERRSIESSKKAVGLRGLQGGGKEQSPQMMLWEDWTNELGDIDKLVKHKDKLRLSNDQYKMIAQKLRATADEIESLKKA